MGGMASDEPTFRCPRCLHPHMTAQTWGGVEVRICMRCGANFFSAGALGGFEGWHDDVPGAAARFARHSTAKVHCPACGQTMGRLEFPLDPPLEIERCPSCHGILLDFEEIRRVPDVGVWARRALAAGGAASGAEPSGRVGDRA